MLLVLSDDRSGDVRIITCQSMTTSEVSCHRLLATIRSWRAGGAPPASLPRNFEKTIAGRRIGAPAGCEASGIAGSGSLTCSDSTVLAWASLPLERKGIVDSWLAIYREKGLVERLEPCVVEGIEGTCHVVRNPSGGPPAVTAAEVVVRGSLLLVSCVDLRPDPGVPPVCTPVISLSTPRTRPADASVGNRP